MKKYIIAGCLVASMLGGGCNKMLEEEPKSFLSPEFLKTEKGVKKGLDAVYGGARYIWGSQDFFVLQVGATDEFKKGQDGNGDINSYASGYTSSQGNVLTIWTQCYRYINAVNGVLTYVNDVDMPESEKKRVSAEAKFMRAVYYSTLVQFFRDVTVTTTFNQDALTTATRHPLKQVLDLIFKDLNEAIPDLQPGPKSEGLLPGKANAAAARHLKGRMLLFRASTPAAEPDDNENAYLTLKEVIDNRNASGVGLLTDFGDIFREGNENNMEVLWNVQHTSNYTYNGPGNSTLGDNVLNHMFVGQYERRPGMVRSMAYGRPYIRVVPNKWVDTAFNNRANDTRFDKTFQTVWFANSPNAADYQKFVWPNPLPPGAPAWAQPGQPRIRKMGDTSIYIPSRKVTTAEVAAAPYTLMDKWETTLSPTVKKYFDNKRADLNDQSIRPVIVWRLAETYLLAAEAAILTNRPQEAADYINVVRRRAAYPSGDAAAMEITAAQATMDFLLDERTRELLGENTRWWDLVRTKTLLSRIALHNGDAAKNIEPRHALRPIPQNQIDNTKGEKYNNSVYFPGWN